MCDLKRDRLLGDKPPSMVVTSRSSREKPGDRMNRQFLAVPTIFSQMQTKAVRFPLYTYIYIIYGYIIYI